MLRCDEEGDNTEVFFDTTDCLLSPQESAALGYEIWVSEPQSVRERRQRFLEGMGLVSDTIGNVGTFSNVVLVSNENYSAVSASSEAENNMFDEMPGCLMRDDDVKDSGSSFHEHRRYPEAEEAHEEGHGDFDVSDKKMKKKKRKWWKRLVNRRREVLDNDDDGRSKSRSRSRRIKVRKNKKRWMELSGVYSGQEIRAHNGIIWAMKFSPNGGKYLASGGEDGVVRIWCVVLKEASLVNEVKQDMVQSWKKQSSQRNSIVLPDKVFQIEESPFQEFFGHSSDVLDLAWSNSEILLSSSMDKTVRLWQIGCDQCLRVFHHNDYVTCIQVNPVNENYFITGSVDGKVRIWGLYEERVVDWADIHDVITAISYQPDGKGFVVGSLSGSCQFYVASGKHFQLEARIRVDGKKRSAGGNKITGIQFSQERHDRVLIASEDSKLRVLEGIDVVHKYRGLPKSGSQMCGSFTSGGNHIISIGQDSHVYIWNTSDFQNPSTTKPSKSHNRSCEYFFSEGVTVAIPWSSSMMMSTHQIQMDMEQRFSRAWFSMDGSCRGSMTWPEEKLPGWENCEQQQQQQKLCPKDPWGLCIVAASSDGSIRTFHNFGLPVRL